MRKTLSLILSALMILSLVVVGVSATPEGTAINTLDDLKAMAADGTYYLNADIDASGYTYEAAFSGKFDGNKHTVTVSQPLFAQFDGTVTNLCLRGAVSGEGDIAAFAKASAGMSAEGLINCATITSTVEEFKSGYGTVAYAAGLVSKVTGKSTFNDCQNTAKISGKINAGGLVGHVNQVDIDFVNCKNTGDIDTLGENARVGGIFAVSGQNSIEGPCDTTLIGCVNTGEIKGGDQVGGLIGWTMYQVSMTDCVNTGNVTSAKNYAGGLISRPGGDQIKTVENPPISVFVNCVNSGNITSYKSQCGGIASYCVTPVTCTGCINSGKIVCNQDGGNASGAAAGLIARVGVAEGNHGDAVLENCLNLGDIVGGQDAAGMIANAGNKNNVAARHFVCKNCYNLGKIEGFKRSASGLIGYEYGNYGGGQYCILENCANYGELASALHISNFIGYANVRDHEIKDCIGAGAYTPGETSYLEIWGCSNSNAEGAEGLSGNILCDGGKTVWWTWSSTADNQIKFEKLTEAQFKRVEALTSEQLAPAKMVELRDAAAEVTMKAAVAKDQGAAIFGGQNPFPAEDPVNPPVVPTGDSFVWFAFAAVVAVVGTALVIRKKVND